MRLIEILLLAACLYVSPVTAFPSLTSLSSFFWQNDNQLILEVNPEEFIAANEMKKFELKKRGINFMDVTKYHSNDASLMKRSLFSKTKNNLNVPAYEYPQTLTKNGTLPELFLKINTTSIYETVAQLSSFYTRYYKSQYGLDSSNWLHNEIESIVAQLKSTMSTKEYGELISLSKVEHDFPQNSLVLRINGKDAEKEEFSSNSTIILGSHQDSINLFFPSLLPAPGCDDDASGTAASIEVLKVYIQFLLQNKSNFPRNNVEFHFYAAEEGGLLGSQDIFHAKKAAQGHSNDTVVAMLQLDQIGYTTGNEYIGVMTDYVSPNLTEFIKKLIVTYLSIPYQEDKCGYACSDHASCNKYGYPSAMVVESLMKEDNKYTHSTLDTIDRLNFDHIAEFVKLGLATILELSDHEKF
ncbi:hypothetical protein ACO0RG_000575 [Hanseniaspora osmophila]|mgnify:CR=1 FL=1